MRLEHRIQPIEIGHQCDDAQIREIIRGWMKNLDKGQQGLLDLASFLKWVTEKCADHAGPKYQKQFDAVWHSAIDVDTLIESEKLL